MAKDQLMRQVLAVIGIAARAHVTREKLSHCRASAEIVSCRGKSLIAVTASPDAPPLNFRKDYAGRMLIGNLSSRRVRHPWRSGLFQAPLPHIAPEARRNVAVEAICYDFHTVFRPCIGNTHAAAPNIPDDRFRVTQQRIAHSSPP